MIEKINLLLELFYNTKYFELNKNSIFVRAPKKTKDFYFIYRIITYSTKNRGRKKIYDIKNSVRFSVKLGKNKKLIITNGNE